jgi:mono/diheme cytochrome c family protein
MRALQAQQMRILLAPLLAACLVWAGGCTPAMDPRPGPLRESFDERLVQHGAALAAIGDCYGCHTTRDGAPFAGGVGMHSPFGTIYSSNITPDTETGIGAWTEDAFRRALRQGVRRDGAHLYPAFPYDRFAGVSDDDARALYAYLMTRTPARSTPPRNELVFPFNVRLGIELWKALYLRAPPAARQTDALLARGEYLVEGLGHCGSCHSPRNVLFAEQRERAYQGGDLEGWHAYAIESHTKAPIPWDVDALTFYLRNGWHPLHGAARGTMGLVTTELHTAPEPDVRAMAAYIVSLMGPTAQHRPQEAQRLEREPLKQPRDAPGMGRDIYRSACLSCHDGSEAMPFGGVPLARSLGLHGESPRNLINVIVHGLGPAQGATSPIMPGYAGALDDGQVVELVAWLRANLTDEAPWPDFRTLVEESRKMDPGMLSFPPGGAGTDPLATKAP